MALIKLDSAELRNQASEMTALGSEYEQLFSNVSSILNDVNNNWSPNLANNFSGKISSAQKGFSNVVEMLKFGAEAANTSAESFSNIDVEISKVMGVNEHSSSLGNAHDVSSGTAHTKGSSKKKKSVYEQIKDKLSEGVDYIKTGAAKVVDGIKDTVAVWKEEYDRKGGLYKVVQTGVAILGGAADFLGVALALGVIGVSGGVAAPIAALMILYAANDMSNRFSDLYNIWFGDIDKVGQVNALETIISGGLWLIGEQFGCAEIGEFVGKVVYQVGEIIPTIYMIPKLYQEVISAPSDVWTLVKDAYSEGKAGIKGLLDIAFNSHLSDLGYDFALWSYEFKNILTVKEIGELLKDVGSTTKDILETGVSIIGNFFNCRSVLA